MKITYSALQEPSCCSTCPSTASPTQETPDNQALLQQTLPVSKNHETTPKPSKALNQKHEGHKGSGAAAGRGARCRPPQPGGAPGAPSEGSRGRASAPASPHPGTRSPPTTTTTASPHLPLPTSLSSAPARGSGGVPGRSIASPGPGRAAGSPRSAPGRRSASRPPAGPARRLASPQRVARATQRRRAGARRVGGGGTPAQRPPPRGGLCEERGPQGWFKGLGYSRTASVTEQRFVRHSFPLPHLKNKFIFLVMCFHKPALQARGEVRYSEIRCWTQCCLLTHLDIKGGCSWQHSF